MLDWLLLMRLTVFNVTCGAGVFWAYKQGLVAPLIRGEAKYFAAAVIAAFLFGLASTFWRGYKVSKLLNEYKYRTGLVSGGRHLRTYADGGRSRQADKLEYKQAYIFYIADSALILLGLLGTVWGVGLMFPEGMDKVEMANVAAGVHVLRSAVALSIVGSLWTGINYLMLDAAVQAYRVDVRQ